MGWCHEFGPQISETCEHPMTAGGTSCSCSICGTTCTGRFAGCAAVWARGPREVAVDAPHFARAESTLTSSDSDNKWRLPLDSLNRPSVAVSVPVAPVEEANGNGSYDHLEDAEPEAEPHFDDPMEIAAQLESPDITARFAVAQLAELNKRVGALTEVATETTASQLEATAAGLEKVYGELRRLTSLREVDLTEQAAGIFGAVQAGTDALEQFAATVREVTDDLRAILGDALAAIGGTQGLAATVAEAQADVASVREDFGAAFARIERDLSVMRQRIPAKPTAGGAASVAKLSREQVDYIVEAVTDAVIGTLNAERATSRRR
jgi:hypothetical protein